MKKKYFAPEMEEVKVDEPVLLSDNVSNTSKEGEVDCSGEGEA